MGEAAKDQPFLLFDLGGVLIENVGFERFDALLPQPVGIDALKQRWLASTSVRNFELGLSDAPDFARACVDEWELSCSPAVFIDEFTTWPKGFYPGALDLIATLRGRHRIGCLTNSNALHWARFDGFQEIFDVTLSSHRIGLIKPDAACFMHAIEACDVDASDILFFDDSVPNVEAARRCGIDAVVANGIGEVRRILAGRGIHAQLRNDPRRE